MYTETDPFIPGGAVYRFECAAILFDLDGVLVDSTASVGRIWKAWAEQRGLDPEEVVRNAQGRRSIETIRMFAPEVDADAANRIVEQMEIEDTLDLKVIPGARELLASIPEGRWAVVTSGTRALATSRLKAARLPMPTVLVAGDDVVNGKPNPEPYRKGAEKLGVDYHQCLVFEDTPAGIAAGKAAKMFTIGLTTTYAHEQLTAADAIVRTMEDIRISTHGETIRIEALSEAVAPSGK